MVFAWLVGRLLCKGFYGRFGVKKPPNNLLDLFVCINFVK